MTATNNASEELTADAFAEKVFGSFLGALDTLGLYAGERMGWYQALADRGPLTSAELAQRTGTNERYAREWLEMQATFGHLMLPTRTAPHQLSADTPFPPRSRK
jgi:hypothetical protein